MQKHNDDTIKTGGHSSLEKYTSHFIRKGCVWEVSWRLNRTATYWPPNSSGYNSISFLYSWAAQPGAWGPSLCWDMVLIPASFLQLIWTSCHTGLYNYLTPHLLLVSVTFALNSTCRQSRLSPDIFDRMHLLFIQVHFLFWQLGQGPICNRNSCVNTYVELVFVSISEMRRYYLLRFWQLFLSLSFYIQHISVAVLTNLLQVYYQIEPLK